MKVRNTAVVLLLLSMVSVTSMPASAAGEPKHAAKALHIADYLLSQQDSGGAIPDYRDGSTSNEDSNMEYALIGLAAAYWYSNDTRYLTGLEKGIAWLADREEMTDPQWRGSWYYVFGTSYPYQHVPTSPDEGITDVRGVDATSSLFVYLLYLHHRLTGRTDFVQQYETHARAALDFVLTRNMEAGNPFSFSSWQQFEGAGNWVLWRFKYTADQGDVYLGLAGGAHLFEPAGGGVYGTAAQAIRNSAGSAFYNTRVKRYALGLDEDGSQETSFDGFDGIFPQGYLPWVLGASARNQDSYAWLLSKKRADGSVKCYTSDPRYTLSAATLAMGAVGLGKPQPATVLDWLANVPYDPDDPESGAVRDTASPHSDFISNVAGFTIVALLGFPAF